MPKPLADKISLRVREVKPLRQFKFKHKTGPGWFRTRLRIEKVTSREAECCREEA